MRTRNFVCIVAAFILSIQPLIVTAQNSKRFSAFVETDGSVPPVSLWFRCIREFKSYDKAEAQKCLNTILSHREILEGRFELHHYKESEVLTFHLKSPSLIVTDVDLGVPSGDVAKAHE